MCYSKLQIVFLLVMMWISGVSKSNAINVVFTTDNRSQHETSITSAERNLGKLLTEINEAQKNNKTYVQTKDIKMDDFSKKSLASIWIVTPFYCDDEEVVDRLWIFKDGTMMCSHVPLIITPKEEVFGAGTYQEAVVEFDRNGNITDFRLSLNAQTAESMDRCGSVVEKEKQMIILQYLERFRTAYNQKDITTIEQLFSDNALIITGKVVLTRTGGDNNNIGYKVEYNKQTKQQYISNLRKAFARNKWIDVKFSMIGEHNEGKNGCAGITRSTVDPTRYGVRLHQSWKSSNYSDEGYLFLLWEFPADGSSPIIHVRTWQPEWVDKNRRQKNSIDENISTLGGFGL